MSEKSAGGATVGVDDSCGALARRLSLNLALSARDLGMGPAGSSLLPLRCAGTVAKDWLVLQSEERPFELGVWK